MRNRIRLELLPLLREKYNPQVDAAILRLATTAEWAGQWLDELGAETLRPLVIDQTDRHLAISAPGLHRKGMLAASQAVRAALDQSRRPLRAVGMEHVRAVLGLLEPSAAGHQVHLPDGLRARREYDKLILEWASPHSPAAGFDVHELLCPGQTPLPDETSVTIELLDGGPERLKDFIARKSPRNEMIDAEKLVLPLIARRWQWGNRFTPLGTEAHKKISDFLGGAKVPLADRRGAG